MKSNCSKAIRFWLVTTFEPIPSDNMRAMRFMALADQLHQRGHKIIIWSTTFHHHRKRHRFPDDTRNLIKPGYEEIVLKSKGYKRNISLSRFLAHRDFARRLKAEFPKENPPDVILVSLPPLDTATATIRYGARENIPVVIDIIDPWPDVFLSVLHREFRNLARILLAPFYWQARNIFSNASGITAISNAYMKWPSSLTGRPIEKTRTYYPAIDVNDFDARVELSGGYKRDYKIPPFRFVYAGALGAAYDVETIVKCAEILKKDGFDKVEFVIAGQGPKYASLVKMAEGLNNVKFLGLLNSEELAAVYASSHVGIACYGKRQTQSVTYKLFDYLGAGLPILSSLESEMATIISKFKVGYNYPPENSYALAAIVRHLCDHPEKIQKLSQYARSLTEKKGDSTIVYSRMADFLESFAK